MSYFNIVAQSSESTVVTEYKPQSKRSEAYQSEADLEKEFIRLLCELGYERLTIHKEADLIANLRTQLEKLNNYRFTDGEWKRFWDEVLANTNSGILEKTRLIQEDYVQVLRRDNGESKNIQLIDKKCIHNNSLQVINQYAISAEEGAAHNNRYDVTVLVNGLPLIHIELKRRGVPIREAFNQIDRYQRDSFWASSGLYEFVQIFVISNGTNTKYYSNTTRFNHIKDTKAQKAKKSKTSNSFEFTSFWADANNRIIPDLVDFTKTFFCKHTILNILTRYCVFTAENMLLVMRPYQIVATERILNRIEIANNYKKYGTVAGGGYIWHTTGSGKTLTSFKTAQLATKLVTFVKDEYKRAHVLPLGHQIFHIFNSCPFEKVKVVILGQDPYPNPGQYYGVCFSVPEGVAIPGSLNNIFKEIHQDLGKPIPASGNLDRWVAQGVFPLNSVLTVRAHETGSHRNMGWEIFTDAVIRKLSEKRENLIFMLWGNYAKEKLSLIDTSKHLVLTSVHPSPRSAEYGFFGCKHFSKANAFLRSKGIEEIDW